MSEITIFFKFLLFDFIWSIPTTFASFSTIEFYATKIIATLVLLVPYKFFRLWKTEIVIMLLLDILLIVNLMYFRTYYTAIPLNSYGLSGNLADFTGSVYDSFRWYDIFFPLSTIASIPLYWHYKRNTAGRTSYKYYGGALGIGILLFTITTLAKGGFKEAYNTVRQKAYLCASTTSMYTVFGSLCYDLINQKQEATPQIQQEIKEWLARNPDITLWPDVSESATTASSSWQNLGKLGTRKGSGKARDYSISQQTAARLHHLIRSPRTDASERRTFH